MTSLPEKTDRKLGLVIDLDTCVGVGKTPSIRGSRHYRP